MGVMRSISAGVIGAVAASLFAAAPMGAQAAGKDLKIYYIDVEGGASTLYVTPQGHTLLIDVGWPAGMGGEKGGPVPTPNMSQRVLDELKALGIKKLDYFALSHYHVDHIGGAVDVVTNIPVGTFLDHGPNREPPRPDATPAQAATSTEGRYQTYMAAIAGKPHQVLKPGDVFNIDNLKLTVVTADAQIIDHSLAASPQPGVDCDKTTSKERTGGEENVRSVGLVMTWGKVRVMHLGDLTWNMENKLVCPTNMVGKVDLMLIDNHGTDLSNSPNLLKSVEPKIVVFDNGVTKGADPFVLEEVRALPSLKGMWQLHFATRSPGDNTAPDEIANPLGDDGKYPLEADVDAAGKITMINPRNGFKQTYAVGKD
jgi:beta-lactamase superfamily II metal-dependent hydrolase